MGGGAVAGTAGVSVGLGGTSPVVDVDGDCAYAALPMASTAAARWPMRMRMMFAPCQTNQESRSSNVNRRTDYRQEKAAGGPRAGGVKRANKAGACQSATTRIAMHSVEICGSGGGVDRSTVIAASIWQTGHG